MSENTPLAEHLPMATAVAAFGPNIEFHKDLAPFTSYRTGGRATYFLSARSDTEIKRAIHAARQLEIPYFVLGGGSNLLISDQGYDGLIVKVDVTGMRVVDGTEIECGAGEELMALVNFASESGLSGIEFLAGIWGSVGGAIYGNAGAFGVEIGNLISELVLVSNDGEITVVPASYCRFAYRDSYLKTTHEVVVTARLKLQTGERSAIQAKVTEILGLRDGKHPNDGMSAGCFFKNIPDAREKFGKLPAGRLLEEIGAKGMQVGGARVFEKHANIIVNTGSATSTDIRHLADILKEKVRERFGITLEEEVQQLGRFDQNSR